MNKDKKIALLIGALKPFASLGKDASSVLNVVDTGTTISRRRCSLSIQIEFLEQSNYIENEYSSEALERTIEEWYSWVDRTKDEGIYIRVIRALHWQLFYCGHLDSGQAGHFRDFPVIVDGVLKPFISTDLLESDISAWCETHGDADTPATIKAAHVAFEDIHPFGDGNGRVGRFIMLLQTVSAGLPVEVIHAGGEEQQEYYKWFK